ncbi:Tn3 family transposase, partial [Streptomyces sp. MCAF7]
RTAMLTAVMRHLEAKAIDDALDLFEILMATRLISTAKRSTDKQRLSMLPQLEKAARITARVSKVVIEELELIDETGCAVDTAALWRALEEIAPRAVLSSAAVTVVSLVPEGDDTAESALRGALALRY